MVRWVVGSILHGVDPLSYFSFPPVLHDWCNKGRSMCYPVCGMVHIKEPLLLIGKSSLCGGSGFPFSLSECSLTNPVVDDVIACETDNATSLNVNDPIAYDASNIRTYNNVNDVRIRSDDDVARPDSPDVITCVSSDVVVVYSLHDEQYTSTTSMDDDDPASNAYTPAIPGVRTLYTPAIPGVRTLTRERFVSSLSPSASIDDVWRTASEYNIYRLVERRQPQTDASCASSERFVSEAIRTTGTVCRDRRLLTDDRLYMDMDRWNLGDRADINMDRPREGGYGRASEGCGRADDLLMAGSSLLDDIKELIVMGDEILNEADEILDGVLEIRRTAGGDRMDYSSELEPARMGRFVSPRRRIQFSDDVRATSLDVRTTSGDVRVTTDNARATTGDVSAITSGGISNTDPVGLSRRVFRRTLDPTRGRTCGDGASGGYIRVHRADWDTPGDESVGGAGVAAPSARQEGAAFDAEGTNRDRHRANFAISGRRTGDSSCLANATCPADTSCPTDAAERVERERLCGGRTLYHDEVSNVIAALNSSPESSRVHFNPGMETGAAGGIRRRRRAALAGGDDAHPDSSVHTAASDPLVGRPDCSANNELSARRHPDCFDRVVVSDGARNGQMGTSTRNAITEDGATEGMHADIYGNSGDGEPALEGSTPTAPLDMAINRTIPEIARATSGQCCSDGNRVHTNQGEKTTLEDRNDERYRQCHFGEGRDTGSGCTDQNVACSVSLVSTTSDDSQRYIDTVDRSSECAEIAFRVDGVCGNETTCDDGRKRITFKPSDAASRLKEYDDMSCSPDLQFARDATSLSVDICNGAAGNDITSITEVMEPNETANKTTGGEDGLPTKKNREMYGEQDIAVGNSAKDRTPERSTVSAESTAVDNTRDRYPSTGSIERYPDQVDGECGSPVKRFTRVEKTLMDVAKRAWWSGAETETSDVKTYTRSRRRSPAKKYVTVADDVTDDVTSNRRRRHSRTAGRSGSRDARSVGRGDVERNTDESYTAINSSKTSGSSRRHTSNTRRSGSVARTTDGEHRADVTPQNNYDYCDIYGKYLSQDRDVCGVTIATADRCDSSDRRYDGVVKGVNNENRFCSTNVENITGDKRRHSSRSRRSGSAVRSREDENTVDSSVAETVGGESISDNNRKLKINRSADREYKVSDADLGNTNVETSSVSNRTSVTAVRSRAIAKKTRNTDAKAVSVDMKSNSSRRHSSRGRRSGSTGRHAGVENRASSDGVELEPAGGDRTNSTSVGRRYCCRGGRDGGVIRSTDIKDATGNKAVEAASGGRRKSSRSRRACAAVRSGDNENKTCNASVETFSDEPARRYRTLLCGTDQRSCGNTEDVISCSSDAKPISGHKGNNTEVVISCSCDSEPISSLKGNNIEDVISCSIDSKPISRLKGNNIEDVISCSSDSEPISRLKGHNTEVVISCSSDSKPISGHKGNNTEVVISCSSDSEPISRLKGNNIEDVISCSSIEDVISCSSDSKPISRLKGNNIEDVISCSSDSKPISRLKGNNIEDVISCSSDSKPISRLKGHNTEVVISCSSTRNPLVHTRETILRS